MEKEPLQWSPQNEVDGAQISLLTDLGDHFGTDSDPSTGVVCRGQTNLARLRGDSMQMRSVPGPPALADSKATLDCSPPCQLASIAEIDAFSQDLVTAGLFTQDTSLAFVNSVDSLLQGAARPFWTSRD